MLANCKKLIHSTIKATDVVLSKSYLRSFKEKPGLIIFLFHSLFLNNNEIERNLVDPQQKITVKYFQEFVALFLEKGYTFISADDIINGIADNRYVMITFDDGYFGTWRALEILSKYNIPATLFISTNHIKENISFWWDIIYRERIKQGSTPAQVRAEQEMLKSRTHTQINDYINNVFGHKALKPLSDTDRPLSPDELKQLAVSGYFSIGNHTSDHAILTNYSVGEIKSQIENSQKDIVELTDKDCRTISYPNGAYSKTVTRIAEKLGFKLGITTEEHKNYLPIKPGAYNALLLGRFTLWADTNLSKQCRLARSDINLAHSLKKIFS